MSFLPKKSLFGKIPKKIYPLTFQVNIKICFENFPQTISFCIKKPIRQQTHNLKRGQMTKYLVNSDIHKHDKMYGTTTMGARGQVVIPAQARKDLKLNPGDQLMVMGKFGKVLGLMKADQLTEVIDKIMESVDSKEWKKEIKKHMEKVIGASLKK